MTPEGRVKEKVKHLLKTYGCYYFMPVQNGMGKPGLDFHCVRRGIALNIETKTPGKWPTARQIITMREMRHAQTAIFVVRDDEDLQELEAWLLGPIMGYLSKTAAMSFQDSKNNSSAASPTD